MQGLIPQSLNSKRKSGGETMKHFDWRANDTVISQPLHIGYY